MSASAEEWLIAVVTILIAAWVVASCAESYMHAADMRAMTECVQYYEPAECKAALRNGYIQQITHTDKVAAP